MTISFVRIITFVIALMLTVPLYAVTVSLPRTQIGDEEIRTEVRQKTSAIFEQLSQLSPTDAQRILTRNNILGISGGIGGEYKADRIEGVIVRIVADIMTQRGRYAVEYYFEGDQLLMTYETFAFFEEDAPQPVTRNFLGAAAWERMSVFDGDKVAYSHGGGTGVPEIGGDATLIVKRANHLRAFMDAKK